MRGYSQIFPVSPIVSPLAVVLAMGFLMSPVLIGETGAEFSRSDSSGLIASRKIPTISVEKTDALPVKSATPKKARIGALDGDTSDLLKKFYDRLAHVKDATSAGMLESAIEMMWHRSGSETVDLLMTRSLTAVNNQDSELALKLLDSVTELAPEFTEGWNRKAYVHFSNKQYHAALQDLRQALALDPKHFKAMDGLANVLREIGDKKRALQIYRTLIKVHPFWPGAKDAIDELRREVDGQEI